MRASAQVPSTALGSENVLNWWAELVASARLDLATLGLKVRSGAFRGSSPLAEIARELH
jgi:hypothetical protein